MNPSGVHARKARRFGARGIAVLVVLIGVVAAALLWFVLRDDEAAPQPTPRSTPSTSISGANLVAEFSGDGDTLTRPVKVVSGWELDWRADAGSGLRVELVRLDGRSVGTLLEAGTKMSGVTFVSVSGTYKLRIESKKPWSLQVLTRPAPKATASKTR